MAIFVCDAIMGSGKSSAAINMMNQNPNEKYIYITPYLDETARIQKACPNLNFVMPQGNSGKFKFSKREHIRELVNQGENIATTHQSYLNFDDEMLKTVKKQKYILIIDESLEIYTKHFNLSEFDTEVLKKAGIVEYKNKEWKFIDSGKNQEFLQKCSGGYAGLIKADREKRNIYIQSDKSVSGMQSNISKKFIDSFQEIFILTYLFAGQELCYFFQLNNIKYNNIYIYRDENNEYMFSRHRKYIPQYTKHLSKMIEICEIDKLNNIGNLPKNKKGSKPFSATYLRSKSDKSDFIKKTKSNLNSWFTYYNSDIPSNLRLWSTILEKKDVLEKKGYIKNYISVNCRATNEYSDKICLAYLIDIYINPYLKNALLHNDIKVDEETYAISTMIQWIWRSAIRNGEKIKIYIPSERMRNLLKRWIADVELEAQGVINE